MEIKYHLIVPTADNAVVCAKNFDTENPERISWYLGRFSDPNKLTFDSVEEALEKRAKTDPVMFPALVVVAAADGVVASKWKLPVEEEAVKEEEVPEELPSTAPSTSAQVKGWPKEVTLEVTVEGTVEMCAPWRHIAFAGKGPSEAAAAMVLGYAKLARSGAFNPNAPFDKGVEIIAHIKDILREARDEYARFGAERRERNAPDTYFADRQEIVRLALEALSDIADSEVTVDALFEGRSSPDELQHILIGTPAADVVVVAAEPKADE